MSKSICEDGFEIDYIKSGHLQRNSVFYSQYVRRLDVLLKLRKLAGKDGYILLEVTLPNIKDETKRGVVVLYGDHDGHPRYMYSTLPRNELFKKENLGRIADFIGSDWIEFLYSDTSKVPVPGKVTARHLQRQLERNSGYCSSVAIPTDYSYRRPAPDELLADPGLTEQITVVLLAAHYEAENGQVSNSRELSTAVNFVTAKLCSSRYSTHIVIHKATGDVVAAALVQNDDPDTLHNASICGLGVTESHRKNGLAHAVVSMALDSASQVFKRASCTVDESNRAIKSLLAKCGFSSVAKTVAVPRLHNGIQPKHRGGTYPVYYSGEVVPKRTREKASEIS